MSATTYFVLSIALLVIFVSIAGGIAWYLNERTPCNKEILLDLSGDNDTLRFSDEARRKAQDVMRGH